MNTKKSIALVIGSGGIKCAVAIGMWRVLQEENISVDSVVVCSGGCLYGTLIANNTGVNEMTDWFKKLWTSDVMRGYTANLKASKDGTLRFNERSGLVDDSVMDNNLREIYGAMSFSDLQIPLKVVTTDMLSGDSMLSVPAWPSRSSFHPGKWMVAC